MENTNSIEYQECSACKSSIKIDNELHCKLKMYDKERIGQYSLATKVVKTMEKGKWKYECGFFKHIDN